MSKKEPKSNEPIVEMSVQKLVDYIKAARKDSTDKADTDRTKSLKRAKEIQKAQLKISNKDWGKAISSAVKIAVAEDAPTNSVGGGAIAGAGVGPQGEPGVSRKKKASIIIGEVLRRKKPKNAS